MSSYLTGRLFNMAILDFPEKNVLTYQKPTQCIQHQTLILPNEIAPHRNAFLRDRKRTRQIHHTFSTHICARKPFLIYQALLQAAEAVKSIYS